MTMRFYHNLSPESGQLRQRRLFALLPITIDNETRWLEMVTIEERFHPGQSPWSGPEWRRKRFIDNAVPNPE